MDFDHWCALCCPSVHSVLCFLAGLTALRSDEVIDLMIKEYPAKHSEYSVILQERERQRIAKEYSVRASSKEKICFCIVLMHSFSFIYSKYL